MSRIAAKFAELQRSNNRALIAFITAGDPTRDDTLPAMHALVRGKADIIELGVPFTDPEADGPSIQRSSERALLQHVTLKSACEIVKSFRETNVDTPVVLMGYLNPILALGLDITAEILHDAGVDGLIVVNLPPEEGSDLKVALQPYDVDLIYLIAPTTGSERVKYIASHGSGFLYYVSIKGITGADHLDVRDAQQHVSRIRKFTDLPIAVGFGIKSAATASEVSEFADGVVVGSRLVDIMGSCTSQAERLQHLESAVASLAASTHKHA